MKAWSADGRYVIDASGKVVAKAYASDECHKTTMLMAAAPDLFEALSFVMTCGPDKLLEALEISRKAIDKANGKAYN